MMPCVGFFFSIFITPQSHLKKTTMFAQTQTQTQNLHFGISSNTCSALQEMDSGKTVVSENNIPQTQSIFLDRSEHIVTILHLKDETHFPGSTLLKSMAVDALEEAKCSRNNGVVVEILDSKESTEVSMDAEDLNGGKIEDDDGVFCEEDMNEEGVKKKLQVLAEMVGGDCLNHGDVLARVVKILKSLEREIDECLYQEN